ncbi:hypothetical protein, partial [Argonema antarcticum]|uniref:hypothetical protein n=1 Tax=Argonema antarcticum TaxID=2942763 RepID=UPI0020117629
RSPKSVKKDKVRSHPYSLIDRLSIKKVKSDRVACASARIADKTLVSFCDRIHTPHRSPIDKKVKSDRLPTSSSLAYR